MVVDTLLCQEIHEQPGVLCQLLERESDSVQRLVSEIRKREIHQIIIAARGTSDNAARYAQYLFGSMNGMIVSLATPSLFTIYGQHPNLEGILVLGISQSGSSPDVIQVVSEGRRQGALTAAITNLMDSDLAKTAEYVINLHAGEEYSLAATKTYTCELTAIALISAQLANSSQMLDLLIQTPELVKLTLSANDHISSFIHLFQGMEYCVVLGRGYNFATAFEFALKLQELTYVTAVPFSTADFFHGPLALIERSFPVFIFAPSGPMLEQMIRVVNALRARGAVTVVASDDQDLLKLAEFTFVLPKRIPEWLSPIPTIIPGQLFTMCLGLARGLNVDHPRSLGKITKTW